jgi:hypothetical protein
MSAYIDRIKADIALNLSNPAVVEWLEERELCERERRFVVGVAKAHSRVKLRGLGPHQEETLEDVLAAAMQHQRDAKARRMYEQLARQGRNGYGGINNG